MFADYECKGCGKIELWRKPHGEEFPSSIPCSCKEGKEMKRVYSIGMIQVCEGFHGNAKNGYTSQNITYVPSNLTPLNKVYGRTGRIAGVESHSE